MPANEACAMPSPMNESLRKTTYVPIVEQSIPTANAATKARCINA
jgi:hypothetical protein